MDAFGPIEFFAFDCEWESKIGEAPRPVDCWQEAVIVSRRLALWIVCSLVAATLSAGRPPANALVERVAIDVARFDRLVSECRHFELREATRGLTDDASLDALYYRGVVANRFGRLDEAAVLLSRFLDLAGTTTFSPHVNEAYASLADIHRRRHRYGALVDLRRAMLSTFRAQITPADAAGHEHRLRLWNALRQVPPQTIEIGGGADVPLVNGLDIAVVFPAGEVLLNPDTGSGLSIIARSDAERLGLQLIDVPVDVTTGTGQAGATLGVAPRMQIGQAVIRHAVFLVFPDAALFRPRQGIQRHGTVGAPVLAALGEVRFTRAGRFVVPAAPARVGGADMFIEDTDPIVEATFGGRRMMLAIDTGADETTFSPLFHREFGTDLPAGTRRVEREVGSVGVVKRLGMLEVPGMAIDLAGQRLAFADRRLVALEPANDASLLFHGALGRDVYRVRERLILSYASMRVAID